MLTRLYNSSTDQMHLKNKQYLYIYLSTSLDENLQGVTIWLWLRKTNLKKKVCFTKYMVI